MTLSSERPAMRRLILVLTWFVAGVAIWLDTHYSERYLNEIEQFGLRGRPEATTPLRHISFSFASDAQTWIRYALQLQEEPTPQLRYTHIDNAPVGREVHWNSAWAWLIASAGYIRHHFTAEPLPTATEAAAVWLNGVVLFAIVIVMTNWAACRAGAAAGFIVMLGMVGSRRFYEGFLPSYVDHHGLLTASVFGLVLGLVFAGAGWWSGSGLDRTLSSSPKEARRNARWSAIAGAVGLWISAASVVPSIALVGIAAVAAVVWRGRTAQQEGAVFDPALWRVWGRTGGILSFAFYLLEYAPSHFGMRMEVNHPLYALAWWGGGESIAQFSQWYLDDGRRLTWRFVVALLAIAAAPLTLLIGGSRVFLPFDPFLAELHRNIIEFMSLPRLTHFFGWRGALGELNADMIPLPVAVAVLWWLRKRRANLVLVFITITAIAVVAMGFWQERWLLNASGPAICVVLVLLLAVRSELHRPVYWTTALICASMLFVVPLVTRVTGMRTTARNRAINPKDALQPLFRDVAAALRASQPIGEIVVLSSPNSSTGIGYYGRFKTVGTLYWENKAGLETAAKIFSARTDGEAEDLIKAHGITHIAMISDENFLKQYYTLLHPTATEEDVKQSFGYRLLGSLTIPVWLEVLPYDVPVDLKILNQRVLLYKVAFNQTPAQALEHFVRAQLAWNDLAGAENSVDRLIDIDPGASPSWFEKGEILVREGKWGRALAAFERSASLAPVTTRGSIYTSAGKSFYDGHAAKYAVHMYRQVLALGYNEEAAYCLSWVLSTSVDPSVRNGPEALAIAQHLVDTHANSVEFVGCLAAALAEIGDTAGAVRVAETAVRRSSPDSAGTESLLKQIAVYRAGRPWRE